MPKVYKGLLKGFVVGVDGITDGVIEVPLYGRELLYFAWRGLSVDVMTARCTLVSCMMTAAESCSPGRVLGTIPKALSTISSSKVPLSSVAVMKAAMRLQASTNCSRRDNKISHISIRCHRMLLSLHTHMMSGSDVSDSTCAWVANHPAAITTCSATDK